MNNIEQVNKHVINTNIEARIKKGLNMWQGKLDDSIHAMIDSGYTDIHVSNVTRQCGGMDIREDLGYEMTIYFNKPRVKEVQDE